LGDILALQSDVARAVAREIQVKLSLREQRRLRETRRIKPQALDAYLKGRYFWNKRSREALEQSVRYFETAVQEDARYAEAYAGLSDCYLRMLDFSFMAPRDAIAKARAATDKALELDDTLAETHTSLAHRSFHEFKWTIADHAFRCAIDLNPNYGIAHYYYSNFLAAMQRFDQAIDESHRALESDPVSPATAVNAAFVLYLAGRYDEAIHYGERALEIDPGHTRAFYDLGLAYEQQGRYGTAIESFRKALIPTPAGPGPRAALAHSYGLAGERRKVLALLRELEQIATKSYVSPYDFVLTSLALGESDRSMSWLTRSYEARSSYMPFVRTDPRLRPLHSDQRFAELVQRMAFPE
jgi:tetratricopeptide (TPR) repeat protein